MLTQPPNRDCSASAVKSALQINRDGSIPIFEADVVVACKWSSGSGIVDEYIKSAEFIFDRPEQDIQSGRGCPNAC